jgi:hypothetical protein
MSGEDEQPRRHFLFWTGLIVVVLIALTTVPFATVKLALKKSGVMGRAAQEAAFAATNAPVADAHPILDLSSLRAVVEKAAENAIHNPQVRSAMKFVKIEAPPAAMQKAEYSVQDVLAQDHQQYVEAVDKDKIRIILILKSKEWPALEKSLSDAANLNGFVYRGPSSTATADGNPESVVAEIEILRKEATPSSPSQ